MTHSSLVAIQRPSFISLGAEPSRPAERFEAFVLENSFPCLGARSAINTGHAHMGSYGRLGADESLQVQSLCDALAAFSAAYPDPSQFDKQNTYYDAASTVAKPRWIAVDVRHEQTFADLIPLAALKANAALAALPVVKVINAVCSCSTGTSGLDSAPGTGPCFPRLRSRSNSGSPGWHATSMIVS